jgi:hypothetical protein
MAAAQIEWEARGNGETARHSYSRHCAVVARGRYARELWWPGHGNSRRQATIDRKGDSAQYPTGSSHPCEAAVNAKRCKRDAWQHSSTRSAGHSEQNPRAAGASGKPSHYDDDTYLVDNYHASDSYGAGS